MARQIFRKKALDNISSPHQLDALLQVTSPRIWLLLVSLAALFVTAIAWSVFGRIPIQISSQVVLVNEDGLFTVSSTASGQLVELGGRVGDAVEHDAALFAIKAADGSLVSISAPQAGTIIERLAGVGDYVDAGSPIVRVASDEQDSAEIILFTTQQVASQLDVGMPARVALDTAQPEKSGYLLSEVTTVGQYPVSDLAKQRLLGSDTLVEYLSAGGTSVEVRLTPLKNPDGSFQWSLDTNSADPDAGTLGVATIVIGYQRPIDLILTRSS